jgi:signal transduction histidine kinase
VARAGGSGARGAALDTGWHLEAVFSRRVQRRGLAYVLATLPLVAVAGALAHGEDAYITVWAVAGGLYTVPALVATWLASRRAPREDRSFWVAWLAALCLTFLCGSCLLVRATTGWDTRVLAAVGLGSALAVYGWALMTLVQARSGARLVLVDSIDAVMSTVLVVTPLVLAFGPRVRDADASWFALPAAVTACGALAMLFLAVAVFSGVPVGRRKVAALGIGFAALATLSGGAQAAQGISGFTLSGAPLILIQAAWMSVLLLFPLHLPRSRVPGFDRLPPEAQIRSGRTTVWLAVLALAALPALTAQAIVLRDDLTWAPVVALIAVAALVLLATIRHLLTVMETQRLNDQVRRAAEDRRRLLAEVLQSAEDDRHRLAAQLHERAVSSYAAFVTFMRAVPSLDGGASPVASVMGVMTRDLERQAESLRQLVLAVRPLDVRERGSRSRAAPISAYVDSLYSDRAVPGLEVAVSDELSLDWTTETIVSRIVKEALRNVRHHAEASRIVVSIQPRGQAVEVRVEDDGVGFDPGSVMFESGIATMRSFADLAQGQLTIESSPGLGTTVIAVLGEQTAPDMARATEPRRRHLRLIRSPASPQADDDG